MNERWTIEELTALVNRGLETIGCDGQESGRVRSVPDVRTIRYYTTLGLLDPPVEMRGRKAYYSRRHALQLVVIKRLQLRGMPLVEVQQAMAGASDRALARWAGLPAGFWDQISAILAAKERPLSPDLLLTESAPRAGKAVLPVLRQREQFWAASPEVPASAPSSPAPGEPQRLRPAVHLPLAQGVELVIDGIEPGRLDQEAIASLSPALDNLVQALRDLRLTCDRSSVEGESGAETSTSSD